MKEKKMIHVVVVEPGKKPEARDIDGSLKSFQDIVGGLIELVRWGKLSVYVDEEGLYKEGLPYNTTMSIAMGMDLVGTAVVSKDNPRTGNEVGLTTKEVAEVLERLKGI